MKTIKIISFKTFLILFIFIYQGLQPNLLCAQTTAIPDPFFEQALIDFGIDSDGIINGQVLTSDIEIVITLDLNHIGIEDITGIEDFTALEFLDVGGNDLTILDVSNNIQLKELYCNSSAAGFSMLFTSLDLSNNVNLEVLHGENLIFLESLDLKNGNNSILLNVTLPCEFEGEPCVLTELNCVMVDDEDAATNDDPPYSSWFIRADFFYSEDCSLGIVDNLQSQVVITPNPTNGPIYIETDYFINSIKVFDVFGRLVLAQNNPSNLLEVSNLSAGLLFVQIETDRGSVTKKIVKE
ncbi:MAG: T9SS type A sorting domain-containing protein [Flavobacteriaceae bacterium]|nr:T9SS type A sorting domain-containing protein [Flavobacteriaceae bacterium]